MKNISLNFSKQLIPAWLESNNENSSIVLSSRIRLARNMAGYTFPNKATNNELAEIYDIVNYTIKKELSLTDLFSGNQCIPIEQITPLQAECLVERHLISHDFVYGINTKSDSSSKNKSKRAVVINADETISLMINEEDHLRYQILSPGFSFQEGYKKISDLDHKLETVLSFAYTPQLGFLTACPSNVGTGLRTSILIHLPGLVLTKEIEKVLRAIWQIGYSVRGLFGEGTEIKGHFFQISNSITLGQSESEIIEGIEKITTQLINYETKARNYLLNNTKNELEDKIYRAHAVLSAARLITSEEALNILATVRLGIAMDIINDVSMNTLNKILLLIRPANLQIFYNQDMTPNERDEKRASLIRQLININNN